jgi:tetratricopeptide (TPR) repeat protein
MFSKMLKKAAGVSALVIAFCLVASAQTAQLEGTIKVKAEDGSIKPVAGAIVDIYRTDMKGEYLNNKTDKSGRYIRIGLPLGTFLLVVSGPGIAPTYENNVRVSQRPVVDIVVGPGDGKRPTLAEVQAALKGAPAASDARPPSAEERAKMEADKKAYDEKVKERASLQNALDEAIKHFNAGHQMRQANNLEGALAEFKQAVAVDPSKEKAFIEVAYKSHASLAETHYMLGADIFNKAKKPVPEAKPHFQEAVKSINKAIEVAQLDAANPNINNELIIYYNILAKSVKPLVQFYGDTDVIDEVSKSYDKAAALDSANKTKWEIGKGELYRLAYRSDDAVAVFKQVLAADPNNADALYGIGLTLVASGEKAKLQDAANYLADFVAKAKPDDARVPEVNASLQALKNEFKVEAEKPSRRNTGRKP